MASFSSILFWSFLFINVVNIQPSSSDLTNVQEGPKSDETFALFDKILRLIGQSQKVGE